MQVYLPTAADFAGLITPSEHLELFHRPGGISSRAKGTDALGDAMTTTTLEDVSEALVALCADLARRDDAGPAYLSLRHLGVHEPERLRVETLAAARSFRRSLPEEPRPPKPERETRTGESVSTKERVAAHRARRRRAEVESAAWWLEDFLADADAPEPGEHILGAALYEQAAEALEDLASDEEPIDEDDEGSPGFALPGPRTFYAVADRMLGPRKRTKHGVVYVMPNTTREEHTTMTPPLFTRAELLAEMARQELVTMREALAATPAHDSTTEPLANVVPFARRAI